MKATPLHIAYSVFVKAFPSLKPMKFWFYSLSVDASDQKPQCNQWTDNIQRMQPQIIIVGMDFNVKGSCTKHMYACKIKHGHSKLCQHAKYISMKFFNDNKITSLYIYTSKWNPQAHMRNIDIIFLIIIAHQNINEKLQKPNKIIKRLLKKKGGWDCTTFLLSSLLIHSCT